MSTQLPLSASITLLPSTESFPEEPGKDVRKTKEYLRCSNRREKQYVHTCTHREKRRVSPMIRCRLTHKAEGKGDMELLNQCFLLLLCFCKACCLPCLSYGRRHKLSNTLVF